MKIVILIHFLFLLACDNSEKGLQKDKTANNHVSSETSENIKQHTSEVKKRKPELVSLPTGVSIQYYTSIYDSLIEISKFSTNTKLITSSVGYNFYENIAEDRATSNKISLYNIYEDGNNLGRTIGLVNENGNEIAKIQIWESFEGGDFAVIRDYTQQPIGFYWLSDSIKIFVGYQGSPRGRTSPKYITSFIMLDNYIRPIKAFGTQFYEYAIATEYFYNEDGSPKKTKSIFVDPSAHKSFNSKSAIESFRHLMNINIKQMNDSTQISSYPVSTNYPLIPEFE